MRWGSTWIRPSGRWCAASMRSLKIEALDRTAPLLPMLPGVPERATHDNRRSGASSLYAALDLASDR